MLERLDVVKDDTYASQNGLKTRYAVNRTKWRRKSRKAKPGLRRSEETGNTLRRERKRNLDLDQLLDQLKNFSSWDVMVFKISQIKYSQDSIVYIG